MAHPTIPGAAELTVPPATAAELGYLMPAEWEPQECVWLTQPHNLETWPPEAMVKAQEQFGAFAEALRARVKVCTTQELSIETNDSWVRDYGPIFVVRSAGSGEAALACHDFFFNGWGNKYEPKDKDNVVPQYIARHLDVPVWVHDFVLEGGSIEVNGSGTVMTTEQCLLRASRNPGMSKAEIERKLHETLGTHHVLWLPGGIEGDDTDGHIDDIARFVAADTVVAIRAAEEHPDHEMLEGNWKALQAAADQDGRRLTVVELPVPEPLFFDWPGDRFTPAGRITLPASYANFLICSGAVFVPVFGQVGDERALRTMEQVMGGYEIVPIRAEHLVIGLGALHCLSMQQPQAATSM
jgi:agmatine deiminase